MKFSSVILRINELNLKFFYSVFLIPIFNCIFVHLYNKHIHACIDANTCCYIALQMNTSNMSNY